jgi:hypothetical protein
MNLEAIGGVERLRLLVQQQVKEAIAQQDDFLFEPFLRDSPTAKAIRRLQTVDEHKKWPVCFARHGCIVCDTRKRRYASDGMCATCCRRTYERLRAVLCELNKSHGQAPPATVDLKQLAIEAFRSVMLSLPASPSQASAPRPARDGFVRPFDPDDFDPESELLARLVKEQIAEMQTQKDKLIFEPFFRSQQVACELQRLLTVPERHKWSAYFDRWGCLRCRTKEKAHAGCGFCGTCKALILYRLDSIMSGRKLLIRGGSGHLDKSLCHLPGKTHRLALNPAPRTIDVVPIRVEKGE